MAAQRWTYRVVVWAESAADGWPAPESLEGLLKDEGAHGWELVAMLPQPPAGLGSLAVFKKIATAWS
jgi:hypothetical protein